LAFEAKSQVGNHPVGNKTSGASKKCRCEGGPPPQKKTYPTTIVGKKNNGIFQPHPKKSVQNSERKIAFAFAFGSAFALALTFALASPLAFWRVFGTPGKTPSG